MLPTASNPAGNNTGFGGVEYLASQIRLRSRQTAKDPNTLTVAAGDLIGASPLVSAAFHDEPTIEALEQSASTNASVGNHEFDEGSTELLRMQNGGCHPTDATTNRLRRSFAGADFDFLVRQRGRRRRRANTLFPPYSIESFPGAQIVFIGMTLEGTPYDREPVGRRRARLRGRGRRR